MAQQILGLMSSYAALEVESDYKINPDNINLGTTFQLLQDHLLGNNLIHTDFKKCVENKQAKFQRINEQYVEALHLRKELGLLPGKTSRGKSA